MMALFSQKSLLAALWRNSITPRQCVPMITVVPVDIKYCHSGRMYGTSTDPSNFYDILEVTPKATQKQIKSSYYRLSKKYHPDINSSKEGKLKFARISEAYETLGNTRLRNLYNRGLFKPSVVEQNTGERYDISKTSVFRGKTKPPTGRTNIYNFDEFYRQHYGDTRAKRQESRAEYDQLIKDKMETDKEINVRVVFISLMSGLFFTYLWFKRHRPDIWR